MNKVCKLTEEGKEIFSWQFDELQDMNNVRAITNTETGEVILAIKVSKKEYVDMKANGIVYHEIEFYTKTGIWKRFDDRYENYIVKMGDILG